MMHANASRSDRLMVGIAMSISLCIMLVGAALFFWWTPVVAQSTAHGLPAWLPRVVMTTAAMLTGASLLLQSGLFWRAAVLRNREHAVRREGEAALFETSALLRAVSDNTPDGIFIRDRDGRFILANPAMAAVLGKNVQEIIGRTATEVLADPDDAAMVMASDRAVMQAGRALGVEESLHLMPGVRTFHSTKAPWLGFRGELLGVVGISTDITERKRTEDTLRAHETQLEALVACRTAEVRELIGHLESTREEEKRAIARELHDELGSALTALNMHLSLLFQQLMPQRMDDERIVRINSLLGSIVTTTRRIQRGLRPDKLDVFGIKIALAEQVQEFARYAGVNCKVSLPDEDVLYEPAIDIALFRMVQEALNNIAKHARAKNVSVILDDTDDAILLTIRDDGIGLPENPAGMLHTHGLRGMKERAGYLGGSVHFASSPGGGTTIRVNVPKMRPAPASASQSDVSEATASESASAPSFAPDNRAACVMSTRSAPAASAGEASTAAGSRTTARHCAVVETPDADQMLATAQRRGS